MDIIDEITKIVGPENIFSDRVECLCYSRDMSIHQGVPDAVVFPRSTEQISAIMELAFPTKLLEALQMGCPVVASATRQVADTFSSGGVQLVPPGDTGTLADTILRLAQDTEERERLAQEGRAQSERFSWNREKQKLIDLYKAIVT